MSSDNLVLFDMACGIGEVTLAVMEWWTSGRLAYDASQAPVSNSGEPAKIHPGGLAIAPIAQRRAARVSLAPPIGTDMSKPTILAADPYTSEAFRSRTSLTCAPLSFRDIAEGAIPSRSPKISVIDHENKGSNINIESDLAPGEVLIEMVICSFALHLIETPSELFALLWELSTKARWLIILAPHKKPDIKDGWGWCKWDVEAWSEARVGESKGEYLQDRVHCRVYRSLNV
ncbi:Uncharacterized protein SCP_0700480 [Sparassis crispa]|uniref:Uncharacterized protein n=1 Tax=Sparassis crispa TaxID=139825 RepID=A0A401GRL1_9APHY|nr:Uncharacterized protein SCP_0700480 [Sparassis crispa]GBE84868.1 Uncharacterized protein SCP_0700480 [Sparassis crispa]